ncbi:TPA: DNA-binding protein [archaeon]|jgi:rRNA-processing protein FCF1|uniref:DNA-binding protein n=1 Tax=Candidatus Undinarchaeum marinum TaxID=2756141 RepID=A0A832X5H4_9ARCH|nr:DNA-binding protein [Candidatus Undinarchaeum marinum]
MKVNKVILDTNALLIPGKKGGRDIFSDLEHFLGSYDAIIPSFVADEVRKLSETGRGQTKAAAKLALNHIIPKARLVEVDKGQRTVDSAILAFAQESGAYVYTNDRGLRDRAKKRNILTIYISQKKYPKKSRHPKA